MEIKKHTLDFLNKVKKGLEEDIMIVKDLDDKEVLDYMLYKSNALTSKMSLKKEMGL